MTRRAKVLSQFVGNDDGPVHGVTFDGKRVWAATGDQMRSFDTDGKELSRLDIPAHAGTAFDGRYLFQIADAIIRKIDPATGAILATIAAPGSGSDSGLAWADGSLWVGQYRNRQIVQIDPDTGEVRRIIQSNRFVTGVTWVDGELWHGFSNDGSGGLVRIDPTDGTELEALDMPGLSVSGVESDGGDRFFCGGGDSGMVRVIARD